ncbi:hypothetical protein [Planctopirus hydrillae]|uniref:Uncharacterized protein n=1 Tax=Planctopirus hydrillae TaxID=1841610 RepID=A0A1C3E4C8_9PLAN|nr:hypothetical protein [Planctopirus hydrillae]ODA28073.1 hypothetical protein A6X21_14525 [Planctopirus hydrillae]
MCAFKVLAFLWAFGFGVLAGVSTCRLSHFVQALPLAASAPTTESRPAQVLSPVAEAHLSLLSLLDEVPQSPPAPTPVAPAPLTPAVLTPEECEDCLQQLESAANALPPVDLTPLELLTPPVLVTPLVPIPDPISTPDAPRLNWELPPSPVKVRMPTPAAIPAVMQKPQPTPAEAPRPQQEPQQKPQAALSPTAPLRPPAVICEGGQCRPVTLANVPRAVVTYQPAPSKPRKRLFSRLHRP